MIIEWYPGRLLSGHEHIGIVVVYGRWMSNHGGSLFRRGPDLGPRYFIVSSFTSLFPGPRYAPVPGLLVLNRERGRGYSRVSVDDSRQTPPFRDEVWSPGTRYEIRVSGVLVPE